MLAANRWTVCAVVLMLSLLPGVTSLGQKEDKEKDAKEKDGKPSAAQQAEINKAIDAGVDLLKKAQAEDGSFRHPHFPEGMSSLCGWALLEGGVPKTGPAIRKVVEYTRATCLNTTVNYSISLAIIFLDRHGDPEDAPLIEALACQLLAQEAGRGLWSYHCPPIPAADRETFREMAKKVREQGESAKKLKRKFSTQGAKLVQSLKAEEAVADASNTQFSMMALWVARRHGVPVDQALARVHKAFQRSQFPSGWPYEIDVDAATFQGEVVTSPAMTCAGLLAYALGHGVAPVRKDKEQLLKDVRIATGMRALATFMDEMSEKKMDFFSGPLGKSKNYYFLWSLERMAVVYDVHKVGKHNWYLWGAELLLEQAKADPQNLWQGEYGIADTCFAILFLKRANVAHDLTIQLFNPIVKTPKNK